MNRLRLVANTAVRRLDTMFPGFFATAKHNHYADFGFPVDVEFAQFHAMYERNGLGRAGVDKTVAKTWQDFPYLQEKARDSGETRKETRREAQIRQRFDDLRLWQQLAECDRRGMVGSYAGLIFRLADSKPFSDPVKRVPGGLNGLVEVIPCWEGQLTVSEWDTDEISPGYGQPKMFQFQESAVDPKSKTQPRAFTVHPDRVLIWSKDGTLNGTSALKAGYNDLMTMEKIVGAGGEGFWKNAKSAPILEIDKEANVDNMAKAMGIPVSEIADKIDEQVGDWNMGFDKSLMIQGIVAKTLQVTLPSPEHFFSIACQSFAASISMPMKILVGMQTGERASTEDAKEWAQTVMSRRSSETVPNIMGLIRRLERFGMIPERDWHLSWTDLTEASADDKINRADKMAGVNQKLAPQGERAFTGAEIRAAAGDYEPLSEADAKVDPPKPAEQPEDPAAKPEPGQE